MLVSKHTKIMVLGQLPSDEKCSQRQKLTLTQPLALTRSQIFSGAIFWLPPNPKTNPNLDRNPNPKWGGGRQLSGYQK